MRALAVVTALSAASPALSAGVLQDLEIDTSTGAHHYRVEIADDPQSREHGLMGRQEMPQNQGMLFEFQVREPVNFWMKDTYISLDFVFIDVDGKVVKTFSRATPQSLALIPSDDPVTGVLELNAGQIVAAHIRRGDKVRFPFFR